MKNNPLKQVSRWFISRRGSTTEITDFVNPDDFPVIFAPDNNNRNQDMGKKKTTSESLTDIFNSFNDEVQTEKSLQLDNACISNLCLHKEAQTPDHRTLSFQERTVYSFDEGDSLSFLIHPEAPMERFKQWMQKDAKVVLTSMFSETEIPFEKCCFKYTGDGKSCILTVTDIQELLKDNFLDRKLVLDIRLENGQSPVEISSDPFILLSTDWKPEIQPTDMFFLEEDDMGRPPMKLVGADPSLQIYLNLNLYARIDNESQWVTTEEMEAEIKFFNEKDDVFFTTVGKWTKTEGRNLYQVNEQVEVDMFVNHSSYRVVACFLGKEIAETKLSIGKDVENLGYEWTNLTMNDKEEADAQMMNLNEMVGLENIKKELDKTVCYMKLMKARMTAGLPCAGKLMHMVMVGSPGTGKTTVARMMGRMFKDMGFLSRGHLVEANRESLTDCIIGGTEKKTRRMLESAKGGVLFIDEAYSLVADENDDRDFGQRVIDTLMTELSNPNADILVILAGYDKEMDRLLRSNPGLASRFPVRINFPDYTPDELMQIARIFFQKNKYTLTEGVEKRMMTVFEQVVTQKNYGNGRFVHTFIQNSILPQMGSRLMEQIEKGNYDMSMLSEICPQDIPDASSVLASMGLAATKSKVIGFSR